MKHPQVNASQSSRNAGLVAVGSLVSLMFFNVIGHYSVLISAIAGACCYGNDVVQDNAPSKYDPLYTALGGVLMLTVVYARHHL